MGDHECGDGGGARYVHFCPAAADIEGVAFESGAEMGVGGCVWDGEWVRDFLPP